MEESDVVPRIPGRDQSSVRSRTVYDQARVYSPEVEEVMEGMFVRKRFDSVFAGFCKNKEIHRFLQLQGPLLSAHDSSSLSCDDSSRIWELNLRDFPVLLDSSSRTISVPDSSSTTFIEYTLCNPNSKSESELEDEFLKWTQAIQNAMQSYVTDFYRIDEEIGRGAFATVMLGYGQKTGRKYAVKQIEKQHTDRAQVEFLAAEVSVMRTVFHPQLVSTFDIFDQTDSLYIVQEYMEGGELYDRIAEAGRFSEKNAQHVVRQILQGLRYLHLLSIVHRDIKPENVLCTKKQWPLDVVLCDFGLASGAPTAEDPGKGRILGTAAYLAPETVKREATGPAVDLWACGVIIYMILTGKQPFAASTEEQVLEKITKGTYSMMPRDWRKISPEAKSLVKALLQTDPKKRLTASAALHHKWLYMEDITDEPIENDLSGLHSSRRRLRRAVFATQGILRLNRLKSPIPNSTDFSADT